MPIADRTLTPGTRLMARYHRQTHVCTIEQNEDGSFAFVLADGSRFKSPSSAGTAVMGGTVACNGWRFWSLEGTATTTDGPMATTAPQLPKEKKRRSKAATKLFKVLKSQDDVPEGQTRWFCSGCMDSFDAPSGETPGTCPQGHGAAAPDQPAA